MSVSGAKIVVQVTLFGDAEEAMRTTRMNISASVDGAPFGFDFEEGEVVEVELAGEEDEGIG